MSRGRPRLSFNWDIVDALVSLGATERYVAEYLLKKDGISPIEIEAKMISKKIKLIQRRIEERWGINYVQYREQKQEDWKIELRQLQRKAAKDGKIVMQIWLGKQDLGQSDKIEEKVTTLTDGTAKLSDEELKKEAERLQSILDE